MYKIAHKEKCNEFVTRLDVVAPHIAAKAKPGQFIIFRVDEYGERIPLTIADCDKDAGTVTIIFQIVGASTQRLAALEVGDSILDFVGPLGQPSHLNGIRSAAVVGGGVGCAIAFPQAKYLHQNGAKVDLMVGFRSKELVILEKEMRENSTNLYIATDDGSAGIKGFNADILREKLEAGEQYDEVIAIGPVPMMRAICEITRPYGIKTTVSLNPIMIDGTGMCGGCRVTVGGEVKFACVDGPEFDGHQVDFDELASRNRTFAAQEHNCRLRGE